MTKLIQTVSLMLAFIAACAAGARASQNNLPLPANDGMHPWALTQNAGQLTGSLADVKYYGQQNGVFLYCRPGRLTFIFVKKETNAKNAEAFSRLRPGKKPMILPAAVSASQMDMVFDNSNTSAEMKAEQMTDYTANFFTSGQEITGVHAYKKLTWINLYPHIDLQVNIKPQGLEYAFVVHPGGKTSDIKITREGMQNMQMLQNGGIKYEMGIGAITEGKPVSFAGQKGISTRFVKNNHTVSFDVAKYDKTTDLVIDPDITWASYYAGESQDEIQGIAADASGDVYIVGSTVSSYGIATNGAYQSTLAGNGTNYDACVAKFNSSGALLWSTYYGGDSTDYGIGICVDHTSSYAYIVGTTYSANGIATKGAYQTSIGSSDQQADAYVAKFSSAGKLVWGTYYGGNNVEYGYSVTADADGNVVIGGATGGSKGLATSGAHLTTYAGGSADGFIARFTPGGQRMWATYFGGGSYDGVYGLTADASKNIYITGVTMSTAGIATTGAYQLTGDTSYGASFMAMLDSTGKQQWGTYYGGAGDAAYFTATNITDDVYFTGVTGNSGLATAGAYQTSLNGVTDAFLVDFQSNGKIKWSTYYGGDGEDYAYGVAADENGNAFVTGYTTSLTGIATKGAFQTAIASSGGYTPDAYVAKFGNTGGLKYATYYGGPDLDLATSVSVSSSGNIYITGITGSTSGIATSGAYLTDFSGGTYDGFVARFNICNLTTSFKGSTNVCKGGVGIYKATDHANTSFVWTATGGTILAGQGTDSVIVEWTANGGGTIKAKEVNSVSGCRDSLTMPVVILNQPAPTITSTAFQGCAGFTGVYHVFLDPNMTNKWSVSGGAISGATTNDSLVVKWAKPGTYTVYVKQTNLGNCSGSDSFQVTVSPIPGAHFKTKDLGGGKYLFLPDDTTTTSFSGFKWDINGTAETGFRDPETFAHNGSYTIKLTVTTLAGCTANSDTTINVTNASIAQNAADICNLKIYPNPFVSYPDITYSLPENAQVSIKVCDVLGRQVLKLADMRQQAGTHTLNSQKLESLKAGTYLLYFTVNGQTSVQQVVKM